MNRRYEDVLIAIAQQGFDAGTFRGGASARRRLWVLGMVAWSNRWFDPNSSAVDAPTIGHGYADVIVDGLRSRAREDA